MKRHRLTGKVGLALAGTTAALVTVASPAGADTTDPTTQCGKSVLAYIRVNSEESPKIAKYARWEKTWQEIASRAKTEAEKKEAARKIALCKYLAANSRFKIQAAGSKYILDCGL